MGGVANFLIAPLFGALHITTALGVSIAPPLVKVSARHFETGDTWTCPPGVTYQAPCAQADLYQKVFWGGLWGLLFLAPLRKVLPRPWLRALIYGARPLLPCLSLACHLQLLSALHAWRQGCGPALVQLFLVFPLTTPYGESQHVWE